MEKKNKRGRPTVTQRMVGDEAALYEKVATNGRVFRSRRSISDLTYALLALGILSKADPKIEDLELIWGEKYECRSILNQLGRMCHIEGYSNNDIVAVARAAIQDKKNGYSVKEIEQYIRHGRLTREW